MGAGWVGLGVGEAAQFILQNRKTKATQKAQRERDGEKMSNARRLLNRRPGRERAREGARDESGSKREWQRMYLSRSQIINRDAVVWIEREGGKVGEREGESMGKWGGTRGNGRKETEKVANGSDRRAEDNTVDMCWRETHFSNVDFLTWSLIKA